MQTDAWTRVIDMKHAHQRWTAVVVLLVAAQAGAHAPPAPHGCQAPVRPADDQDDTRWQRYLDSVDAYRACISDYVTANQAAARAHGEAARAATLDWNAYVRDNLNVPEDYPWPPESRD